MVGRHSTVSRQANLFKPRVYQSKGRPLINSGTGVQYYNRNNINRFYEKIGLMVKISL